MFFFSRTPPLSMISWIKKMLKIQNSWISLKPTPKHRSHHSESNTIHFTEIWLRMLPESCSDHFVKQLKKLILCCRNTKSIVCMLTGSWHLASFYLFSSGNIRLTREFFYWFSGCCGGPTRKCHVASSWWAKILLEVEWPPWESNLRPIVHQQSS